MTAPVQVGPSSSHGGPTPSPASILAPRELQILVLAANGKPNKVIGSTLGIAEETVKSYIRRILRKLRSDNRAQATSVALKLKLIDSDDIFLPGDLANVMREDA